MKLEIVFEDGRKETFDSVASFTEIKEQPVTIQNQVYKIAQSPVEGKVFLVNPLEMNRSYFEKTRMNKKQESTRHIILEAFDEVDKNPEKYADSFYTLIPEKKWNGYKTVANLKEYAKNLGGQTADWVQQALEWAQRICNGESWECICKSADTAEWYRMILWKDGKHRIVGGMRSNCCLKPVSEIDFTVYVSVTSFLYVVPLVVFKKK